MGRGLRFQGNCTQFLQSKSQKAAMELLKGTRGRKGKKEVKEVAALQKLGGSKQQGGFQ